MFKWPLRRKSGGGTPEPVREDRALPPTVDSALNTDLAWEEWGRCDPYFGVITHGKFRRSLMTAEAKREFFDSGHLHVDNVTQVIRRHIDANFTPGSVLDFGCGVGRTAIPFARLASQVVGADVSPPV